MARTGDQDTDTEPVGPEDDGEDETVTDATIRAVSLAQKRNRPCDH